jgi:hypothetical protein
MAAETRLPSEVHCARAVGVVDELMSRRSDFHAGRAICLADLRTWTFPAPVERWIASADTDQGDYVGLIRAILEAESHAEARLAELALAMFLLGQNYRLTPQDYQELFTFTSDSAELANSQSAFHDLALDHIGYLAAAGALRSADPPCGRRRSVFARAFDRVRTYWTGRRLSLIWRKGEITPCRKAGSVHPISHRGVARSWQ